MNIKRLKFFSFISLLSLLFNLSLPFLYLNGDHFTIYALTKKEQQKIEEAEEKAAKAKKQAAQQLRKEKIEAKEAAKAQTSQSEASFCATNEPSLKFNGIEGCQGVYWCQELEGNSGCKQQRCSLEPDNRCLTKKEQEALAAAPTLTCKPDYCVGKSACFQDGYKDLNGYICQKGLWVKEAEQTQNIAPTESSAIPASSEETPPQAKTRPLSNSDHKDQLADIVNCDALTCSSNQTKVTIPQGSGYSCQCALIKTPPPTITTPTQVNPPVTENVPETCSTVKLTTCSYGCVPSTTGGRCLEKNETYVASLDASSGNFALLNNDCRYGAINTSNGPRCRQENETQVYSVIQIAKKRAEAQGLDPSLITDYQSAILSNQGDLIAVERAESFNNTSLTDKQKAALLAAKYEDLLAQAEVEFLANNAAINITNIQNQQQFVLTPELEVKLKNEAATELDRILNIGALNPYRSDNLAKTSDWIAIQEPSWQEVEAAVNELSFWQKFIGKTMMQELNPNYNCYLKYRQTHFFADPPPGVCENLDLTPQNINAQAFYTDIISGTHGNADSNFGKVASFLSSNDTGAQQTGYFQYEEYIENVAKPCGFQPWQANLSPEQQQCETVRSVIVKANIDSIQEERINDLVLMGAEVVAGFVSAGVVNRATVGAGKAAIYGANLVGDVAIGTLTAPVWAEAHTQSDRRALEIYRVFEEQAQTEADRQYYNQLAGQAEQTLAANYQSEFWMGIFMNATFAIGGNALHIVANSKKAASTVIQDLLPNDLNTITGALELQRSLQQASAGIDTAATHIVNTAVNPPNVKATSVVTTQNNLAGTQTAQFFNDMEAALPSKQNRFIRWLFGSDEPILRPLTNGEIITIRPGDELISGNNSRIVLSTGDSVEVGGNTLVAGEDNIRIPVSADSPETIRVVRPDGSSSQVTVNANASVITTQPSIFTTAREFLADLLPERIAAPGLSEPPTINNAIDSISNFFDDLPIFGKKNPSVNSEITLESLIDITEAGVKQANPHYNTFLGRDPGCRGGHCGVFSFTAEHAGRSSGLDIATYQAADLNKARGTSGTRHVFNVVIDPATNNPYVLDLTFSQFIGENMTLTHRTNPTLKDWGNIPLVRELLDRGYFELNEKNFTEYLNLLALEDAPSAATLDLLDQVSPTPSDLSTAELNKLLPQFPSNNLQRFIKKVTNFFDNLPIIGKNNRPSQVPQAIINAPRPPQPINILEADALPKIPVSTLTIDSAQQALTAYGVQADSTKKVYFTELTIDGTQKQAAVHIIDPELPEMADVFQVEINNAQVFDQLGIGASFYGLAELPNNQLGYVTEKIDGVENLFAIPSTWINNQTLLDLQNARNVLTENGFSLIPDNLQYMITPEGRLMLIDPGNLLPIKDASPETLIETNSLFDQNLNLLQKQGSTLNKLKTILSSNSAIDSLFPGIKTSLELDHFINGINLEGFLNNPIHRATLNNNLSSFEQLRVSVVTEIKKELILNFPNLSSSQQLKMAEQIYDNLNVLNIVNRQKPDLFKQITTSMQVAPLSTAPLQIVADTPALTTIRNTINNAIDSISNFIDDLPIIGKNALSIKENIDTLASDLINRFGKDRLYEDFVVRSFPSQDLATTRILLEEQTLGFVKTNYPELTNLEQIQVARKIFAELNLNQAVNDLTLPTRAQNEGFQVTRKYIDKDFGQDAALILDSNKLLDSSLADGIALVADGHGDLGHIASKIAKEKFNTYLHEAPFDNYVEAIHYAFGRINQDILDAIPLKDGGGTTLTVAIQKENEMWIGHIGDSRLYLVDGNNGSIKLLTTDHDWPGGVRKHTILVSRSLGDERIVQLSGGEFSNTPDILGPFPIKSGDYIVVGSDSLEKLGRRIGGESKLEKYLSGKVFNNDPHQSVYNIADEAERLNVNDDIGIAVMKVDDTGGNKLPGELPKTTPLTLPNQSLFDRIINFFKDLISFRLVTPAYAQEDLVEARVVPMDIYRPFASQVLLNQALEELPEEQLTTENVAEIMMGVSQIVSAIPETGSAYQNQDGKAYGVTGLSGAIEGQLSKGIYQVKVAPVPGVQLVVPETLEIAIDQSLIVNIGVIEGGKGIISPNDWRLKFNNLIAIIKGGILDLFVAQAQTNDSSQTPSPGLTEVQLYLDQDGNGQRDFDEPDVPWAGVAVELTPTTQAYDYQLNQGWNLIAFPFLPTSVKSASDVITDINLDGGSITTIAYWDSDHWVEFSQVNDQPYGQDFALNPNTAYFVDASVPLNWSVAGETLTGPNLLDLHQGWNTLTTTKTLTANDFIEQINTLSCLPTENCEPKETADALTNWTAGTWQVYVSRIYSRENQQTYGDNFSLEPIRGYMVRLKEGVSFTQK